jgi:hypothetical protein
MKKLSLDVAELQVESYATQEVPTMRGTVEAASLPTLPLCTRYGCVSSYCPSVPCTKPEYFCPAEW